jgi:hypothetical protein
VAKTLKYLLNPVVIGQCTVAIATAKSLPLALTTEVVDLAEEEGEDIKLPIHSFPSDW